MRRGNTLLMSDKRVIIVKGSPGDENPLKDLSDYAKSQAHTHHFNFGAQTQNIRQTTGPCQSIVGSASVRIQKCTTTSCLHGSWVMPGLSTGIDDKMAQILAIILEMTYQNCQ